MPTLLPNQYFIFVALQGVFGNLVTLNIVYVEGAANYASSVTDTAITITLGTTLGVVNLDWAAIASLFNADGTVIFFGSMVGLTGDKTFNTGGIATGGSSGSGQGEYVLKSFGGVYSFAAQSQKYGLSIVN
jgi:hypothetical protein